MSDAMDRLSRGNVAVFTRNHLIHLDQAVALGAADPNRLVTFRASTRWASAERAVSVATPLPLYIAVVGGPGLVEYTADLCDVHTRPRRGDPKTERLLRFTTPSTEKEGLWEQYDKEVKTLYVIKRCIKLAQPFALSDLNRLADGQPLSDNFRYSYALVSPRSGHA